MTDAQLQEVLGSPLFTPKALTKQIEILRPPSTAVLGKVFSNAEGNYERTVVKQITKGNRAYGRVVPYAHAGAVPSEIPGSTTKGVTLPRIAETFQVDAIEVKRKLLNLQQSQAGGNYIAENLSLINAKGLQELLDKITRRHEIMAAQAIVTGTVTDLPGDKEKFSLSFGYQNGVHNITLTSTARWSESGAQIVDNLETWARTIFQKVSSPVKNAFIGSAVTAALRNNTKIVSLIDKNSGIQTGELFTGGASANVRYIGELAGIKLWEYSDIYGTSTPIFPVNRVVLFSESKEFSKVHYSVPLALTGGNEPKLIHSEMGKMERFGYDIYAESVAAPIIWEPDNFISVQVID